jgi:ArsR family transcriptional regulator
MDGREVCVCYFVEILEQSQPKISRHLAYLRRAGVVAARREGKWMHYKITVPLHAGQPGSRETLTVVREEKGMKTDLARLSRACSAPQRLCGLEGVPLPIQIGAVAWLSRSAAFRLIAVSSAEEAAPSSQ